MQGSGILERWYQFGNSEFQVKSKVARKVSNFIQNLGEPWILQYRSAA